LNDKYVSVIAELVEDKGEQRRAAAAKSTTAKRRPKLVLKA